MANQDPELWEKASDARETLERNLAEDQEVGYVDIGCGQSEADATCRHCAFTSGVKVMKAHSRMMSRAFR